MRRVAQGVGAIPSLGGVAAILHTVWLAAVVLAFVAPAWALLRETAVFWHHATYSIAYRGQMDYGESPLLAQAVQWLHGQQIYHNDAAPPFTVGNYTPIFTWATAAVVALWTGVQMGAGRVVSVVACLGTAAAIGGCTWEAAGLPLLWPHRGTLPRGALGVPVALRAVVALFAGCVYLSTRYVWSWGVLGRVDSLAVCFSMAGCWCVLRQGFGQPSRSRDTLWLAGLLFACAVYTRQDLVEGAAASILGLALYDWRRAVRLALWSAVFGAGFGTLLLVISHGQFYLHVFVYNENRFFWSTVRGAWMNWLQHAGGAVLLRLAIAGALIWLLSGGQTVPGLLLGATILSSITVGKIGSSINYFMPLLAACCWCVGLLGMRAAGFCCGAPTLAKWIGLSVPALFLAWATGSAPGWSAPLTALAPRYAHLMARAESSSQTLAHTLRSANWGWTPMRQPDAQWQRLIDAVRTAPGPVVSEDMSYVVLAGKPLAFQPFELTQASADGHWNATLFTDRVRQGAYALIILPVNVFDPRAGLDLSRWSRAMYAAVEAEYVPVSRLEGQWLYRPAGAGRSASSALY